MKSVKVAYVFLIILLAILGYVSYLKFSYVEEKKDNILYESNSVSLSSIVNNYNNANYEEGVKTTATINGNNLTINYNNKDYIFSFTNGILKYNVANNNNIKFYDIDKMFVYLVDSVSVSMGNKEKESYVTTNLIINKIYVNDSVKIINTSNEITYVIDTTKNMVLYKASNIYKDSIILNINDSNFDINMNNIELISPTIKFNKDINSFEVLCYVLNSDNISSKIVVTLYDKDKEEVTKQEIDTSNIGNVLNMKFELDGFKEEDIIYYSLEIK